jgi:hypothetical protein
MFSRTLNTMKMVISIKESSKGVKMLVKVLIRSYFSCFSTLSFHTWYHSRPSWLQDNMSLSNDGEFCYCQSVVNLSSKSCQVLMIDPPQMIRKLRTILYLTLNGSNSVLKTSNNGILLNRRYLWYYCFNAIWHNFIAILLECQYVLFKVALLWLCLEVPVSHTK